MNKRLLITISLCIMVIGSSIVTSETVRLRLTNNTITTNQNVTFDFIGLNQSQMYIIVFTNHASTIANITFTSSGFEHSEYVFIPNDNDTSFTISLYQYSVLTNQNSSSALLSIQISEIQPNQYNNQQSILGNLYFILPILIIAVFAAFVIKPIRQKILKK